MTARKVVARIALGVAASAVLVAPTAGQASPATPGIHGHTYAAEARALRDLPRAQRRSRVHADARQLAPCRTEDSTNCVWRARLHGNGQGRTFIALGQNAHRFYWNGDVSW